MLDESPRCPVAFIVVCTVIVLAFLSLPIMEGEICKQYANAAEAKCSANDILFVLVRPYGKWFSWIEPGLVAISTFAIAIFTWRLKVSTDKLWRAAQEQSKDAKAAIAAAEDANRISRENATIARRAWISIKNVELYFVGFPDATHVILSVGATVKNIGESPATAVNIRFGGRRIPTVSADRKVLDAEYNAESKAISRFKADLRRWPTDNADIAKLRSYMAPINATKPKPPYDRQLGSGGTVFPNEALATDASVGVNIEGGVVDCDSTPWLNHPPGEKQVFLTIFVGVAYRIVGDEVLHITFDGYSANIVIGQTGLMKLERSEVITGETD